MTAATAPARDLDDLTIRQAAAARLLTDAERTLATVEVAVGDVLAAGDNPTDAQLDALATARERLNLAILRKAALLRWRRDLAGGAHPDGLDAVTVAIRAVRGIRLHSGRVLGAGQTAILTLEEAVAHTRLGALELVEAPPAEWPRSVPTNLGAVAATLRGTR